MVEESSLHVLAPLLLQEQDHHSRAAGWSCLSDHRYSTNSNSVWSKPAADLKGNILFWIIALPDSLQPSAWTLQSQKHRCSLYTNTALCVASLQVQVPHLSGCESVYVPEGLQLSDDESRISSGEQAPLVLSISSPISSILEPSLSSCSSSSSSSSPAPLMFVWSWWSRTCPPCTSSSSSSSFSIRIWCWFWFRSGIVVKAALLWRSKSLAHRRSFMSNTNIHPQTQSTWRTQTYAHNLSFCSSLIKFNTNYIKRSQSILHLKIFLFNYCVKSLRTQTCNPAPDSTPTEQNQPHRTVMGVSPVNTDVV